MLEVVKGHVAAVLGHPSASAIEPDIPFGDLGFDSLAAVELRNRINAISGLDLSPTTVFDYPSAAILAEHLLEQVGSRLGDGVPRDKSLDHEAVLASVASLVGSIGDEAALKEEVGARLRSLLAELTEGEAVAGEAETIAAMSHDEMFELIDKEFGA